MKKLISVISIIAAILILAIPVLAMPEATIKDTFENPEIPGYSLPYNLFLPEDYNETTYYPVILFLHGAGERGTDNSLQLANYLPDLYATSPELMGSAIVIAPQCPNDEQWVNTPWEVGTYSVDEIPESNALNTALKLLEHVVDTYGGDRCRIYITGISMGGFGTWDAIMRHEEIFAAAVPICGGADPTKAEILKNFPIITYHDTGDRTVPADGTKDMVKAIRATKNKNIKFNILNGYGHGAWLAAGVDAEMIDWLFAQNLATRYPEAADTQPRETEPPVTEPPVTEAPITEAPATEAPVVDHGNSGNNNVITIVCIAVVAVAAIAAIAVIATKKKK